MEELKPCPFCGGKAEYITESGVRYRYKIQCTSCKIKTGGTVFENNEFNAKEWNTRTQPQNTEER